MKVIGHLVHGGRRQGMCRLLRREFSLRNGLKPAFPGKWPIPVPGAFRLWKGNLQWERPMVRKVEKSGAAWASELVDPGLFPGLFYKWSSSVI